MTEQDREEAAAIPPAALDRKPRRWRVMAAASVVGVAGALALVALHRPTGDASRYAVEEQGEPARVIVSDPLTVELNRCRELPPQADDPGCRAAWEESRRRFFGEDRSRRAAVPSEASLPASSQPNAKFATPAEEH